PLSKELSPKTTEEIEDMKTVPYASAVGSLMYAMLCTRPDISYAVGMVAIYQSNPEREHWAAVKHILKYLRRTKEYMLVYRADSLSPLGYSDSDFLSERDESKSTSGYVFNLGGGAISWRSAKQKCVADSTMEAEYIAASEAAKEAVWLKNFLVDLEVIPSLPRVITVHCDNSGAVANSREPRAHRASKNIERKYHFIRDIVARGEVEITKIASEDKLADPFTKSLPEKIKIALGNGKEASSMLDLGAGINLMQFSIFHRLGLRDLRPTRMCLQLAERSIRYPKEVVEDVLVRVRKLIALADFIVLDVGNVQKNGKNHTILLGRPFMATTNTLIDVRNETLNMRVLGESVSISVREATSASSVNFVEECTFVDVSDPFMEEIIVRDLEERLMPDLEEEEEPTIELFVVDEPDKPNPSTLELKELLRHL
ncbi:cysteine-rich RLK (RECEPTOR-like protein kinase) 8, partial [Striga hermonthica]